LTEVSMSSFSLCPLSEVSMSFLSLFVNCLWYLCLFFHSCKEWKKRHRYFKQWTKSERNDIDTSDNGQSERKDIYTSDNGQRVKEKT
jgi:hypothetical protein